MPFYDKVTTGMNRTSANIKTNTKVKTKVTEGGRIVIPARFRHALGIEIGETVTLSLEDDQVKIVSSLAALKRLQKRLRSRVPEGVSIVDEFIRERREEAATE
jgi:AbrB family looped-hinge helix DNA binding protein